MLSLSREWGIKTMRWQLSTFRAVHVLLLQSTKGFESPTLATAVLSIAPRVALLSLEVCETEKYGKDHTQPRTVSTTEERTLQEEQAPSQLSFPPGDESQEQRTCQQYVTVLAVRAPTK